MNISVVLATYNGEKYLLKQLKSILEQTKSPNEVLIFDDKSSDSTIKIINDFIENNHLINWVLYQNETNLGFRNNFKQGLAKSSGDIVFLCDQDDIWDNRKIKVMANIMNDKKILSLASSFTMIDEKDEPFYINNDIGKSNNNLLDFPIKEKELFNVPNEFLIKKNFAQGCTMAIRREIIDLFLRDEMETLEHDWSLSLIASLKKGCYFYNESLIKYRIHTDNEIGLKQVLGPDDDYQKERLKNRVDLIKEELKRVYFSLQFSKEDSLLIQYKEYYELRISCIKENKIGKLISKGILGQYRHLSSIRSIAGDIISIFKKS